MTTSDVALDVFKEGFNCAQSVVAAFSNQVGLDGNTGYRAACGFGAGMGRLQKTCGAVTGGIMIIGMKYGRDAAGTDLDKERTYQVVQSFVKEFERKHASTECRELLGCDLTTEEGRKHYLDARLHSTICMECVNDAVVIIDGLIDRQ